MKNWLRKLRSKQFAYRPLVEVEISQANLLHNFLYFQQRLKTGVRVAPVLKSNAYGHGLVGVARIVDQENPPFLVVDSYFEAMILRNEGIGSPILVIGYTWLENIEKNGLDDVSYTVTSLEWLERLNQRIKYPVKIHLKIDTGMNRQGIEQYDLDGALNLIKENKLILLEGICSHLADGDNTDIGFTNKQIKRWNNIVRRAKGEFQELRYWHLGASSSLYFQEKISANVMRLGLSLYGIGADLKLELPLKPVLSVKTYITSVRQVKSGEKVGYSCTYKVPRDGWVATIPVGYNEGLDRRLSNQGWVKVKNQYCPIVGRVSMNITSIDVTDLMNGQNIATLLEEPVEVISAKAADRNSIENMAKTCATIPYELLVHFPEKLRRTII